MKMQDSRSPDPIVDSRAQADDRGMALRETVDVCERVSEEMAKRLLANSDLDISHVHVAVLPGDEGESDLAHSGSSEALFVTLSGSVVNERQRSVIEELAASCEGVKRIDNQLRVADEHIGER